MMRTMSSAKEDEEDEEEGLSYNARSRKIPPVPRRRLSDAEEDDDPRRELRRGQTAPRRRTSWATLERRSMSPGPRSMRKYITK